MLQDVCILCGRLVWVVGQHFPLFSGLASQAEMVEHSVANPSVFSGYDNDHVLSP